MLEGDSDPGKGHGPLSSVPGPQASPAHFAGLKAAPDDLADEHQAQIVVA